MYTTPNKRVWKPPTSTQLCATWHTDSLDMVVLPSTGASRYHNCCIDGGTSPENCGYHLVHYAVIVILKLINSFTVLNYGPKRLVAPAVLRMPEPCMYAKITQTDFTTPERKRLNRVAVTWSSDLASQDPTPLLRDSRLTYLNSLPSLLSPQKNLHVQPLERICS